MPPLYINPNSGQSYDTYTGSTSAERVVGNPWADTFNMGGGGDRLTGGGGDDQYTIFPGDVVIENPGEGVDSIQLLVSGPITYVLPDNVENLTINQPQYSHVTLNAGDNTYRTFNSSATHNTIDGGAGNDIIWLSPDSDVATGGSGHDIFAFQYVPWGMATVTDFQVGEDAVDLRTLFSNYGYKGSDAVADGWAKVVSDGAGGAIIQFDPDGPSNATYGLISVVDLKGVDPASLHEQQDWYFKDPGYFPNLTTYQATVYEAGLPNGSGYLHGYVTNQAGYFNLAAPNGASDVWVDGHQVMSGGVFTPGQFSLPNGDELDAVRYDPSQHELVLGFTLKHAESSGGDWLRGFTVLARDATGGMAQGQFTVLVHDDNPQPVEDDVAVAAGGTVTGNLLTNDKTSADGGVHVYSVQAVNGPVSQVSSGAIIAGQHGTLTIHSDGSFSYAANSGVAAGTTDTFSYHDADSDSVGPASANLVVTIGAGSPPPPPPPPSPPPPPPPSSGGTTQQGQSGGSNLQGGAGDDTLIGGTGPDTMTGAGGADHFVWNALPWSPGHVTDFTDGTDKLDFSGLLSAYHYSGTDPVGDGWVKPINDGNGNTWLYFDTDGRGTADQWGTFVTTLDHVSASQITSADLVGGSSASPPPPTSPPPVTPPPPPSSAGVTLQGQPGGSNLQGTAGDDTLIGGSGPDTMTGAAGADHFVWNSLPWSAGQVTDFTHGTDRIDLSLLLSAYHYSETDPIADGYVKLLDDGHGNTWLYFDTDGHGSGDQWGTFVTTLQNVSAASLSGSDFIFH